MVCKHKSAFRLLPVVLLLLVAAVASAAPLPAGTRAALKKLKLKPSILASLDQQLEVPPAWLKAAAADGPVQILGTWDPRQFRALAAIFHAHYPQVQLDYSRAERYDRSTKPLIALESGRDIADVIMNLDTGLYPQFVKLGGLADLSDLPNYRNVASIARQADDHHWAGYRVTYRCMGYNPKRIDKKELPTTWDALLTNPYWRVPGHLALTNTSTSWLLNLWGIKGEAWTKHFVKTLFTEVKPQLRKEGENASLGLVGLGEFDAVIPSTAHRVAQRQHRGEPVALHCPDIVPASTDLIVIFKGAPHEAGARIFVNWLLSREGQITDFVYGGNFPTDKDLIGRRDFQAFPAEISGKRLAPDVFKGSDKAAVELTRYWGEAWNGKLH